MAMVQGMQTVLFSHIRQPNPAHQLIESNSNLKDLSCMGYRDDGRQVGSQSRQIISSEVRKQRFTRTANHLRFSQQDSEWLSYRSIRSGKLHSIGGGRIALGPVYCLKTSEVEQVSAEVSAEEKPVNSAPEVKNVDSTDDWAVKKGLSALDAYFDKLNASNVEETPGVASHSEGTVSRVSTTVPPSSIGRTGSVIGSQVSETGNIKKDHVEGHEEENTGGLHALDAYFDKLRPSEPETGKHMPVTSTSWSYYWMTVTF